MNVFKRETFRWTALALLLAATGHVSGVAIAQSSDDVVMRAMRDELTRSMSQLRLQQMEKPYFIAYRVQDIAQQQISATLGSLTNTGGTPVRNRLIGVELRVGDYKFDNSNFISMQRARGGAATMFLSAINEASLDDNYAQLRRELWLSTDRQYKRAIEDFSAKQAASKSRNMGEEIPDFSQEQVVNASTAQVNITLPVPEMEALARELSAVFRSTPLIDQSSVKIEFKDVYTRYMNSEGTVFTRSAPLIKLEVTARAQSQDGIPISDSFTVYGHKAADLPSKDNLKQRVVALAGSLQKVRAAATVERYNGPVLFEGPAAGEILLQQFGSRLAAARSPMSDNLQFENVFLQMLDRMGGSSLQEKMGARVMPEFLSVSDNPLESSFHGNSLFGTLAIDDDGVKTRKTVLIEHGILKNLLSSRVPVRQISQSSGSRRGWAAVPSNLFVNSEKSLSAGELRQQLLKIAKDRGLDYAVIIRRVGGGAQASFVETIKAMTNQGVSASVSEAYKIFADGHEEPLRGVHIAEMPAESFKEIVATGDEPALYSDEVMPRVGALFSMGMSAGNDLPVVSCIAPSLLFEEISLSKVEGPFPARPISESPLAEK